MKRKRYRVAFTIECDVWATSEEQAQEFARDRLIDDGTPYFVMEWMSSSATTESTDNEELWNPINEEDEEDE